MGSSAPTLLTLSGGGGGGTDQLVKVTASDTVAGYLLGSLVVHADTPIALNILNPSADESLQLELDGDQVYIDWVPTNYTRNATIAEAADVTDLSAHLKGIDDALASVDSGQLLISAADTTEGYLLESLVADTDTPLAMSIQNPGADEKLLFTIDGDHLDIDFVPTNYVRDATISEAADVNDLSAHLYGIDVSLDELFQQAENDYYSEYTYAGDNLSVIDIWETASKISKLFDKTLSYTGDNLTSVVTNDLVRIKTKTLTLTYSGDNLDTTTTVIT